MATFTTEQLTQRWEDQRALKNLMGKYANCLILNREQDIFDLFWTSGDDICLSFNDGTYVGTEAVKAYYAACCASATSWSPVCCRSVSPSSWAARARTRFTASAPSRSSLCPPPVIEVAADGKTAKGLWYWQGAYNDVETCGPVAN